MSAAAHEEQDLTARHSGIGRRPRRPQRGIGYLVVLFWLALGSLALAGEAMLWSMERQREREEELLFAGDQIRRAIGSYYEATPSGSKRLPPTLEVLLEDTRFLPARRHLRQIHVDPMTGTSAWGLMRGADGGLIGVHSRSQRAPLKRRGFAAVDAEFEHKTQYAEWHFVYHGARTLHLPPVMLPSGGVSPDTQAGGR